MAARFRKRDRSVEAGFHRIALAQIDAAIALVDDASLPEAERIHRVRRQMKALRALLRLVRPAFPDYRAGNRAFRNIARTLSGTRDAKVMLDTFDLIAARGDGRPPPRHLLAVRGRLVASREAQGDEAQLLRTVRPALLEARARAKRWRLSQDGWPALSGGLSGTYGQARDAMRRALLTGDAEASHEWRKGVKYHGAQAQLLGAMKPGVLVKEARAAKRLGDLLGQRHDIDMFLERMAAAPTHFGDVVAVTQLAGLARLHLARLDRRTERLGRALFAEKPGKLAGRWRGWWNDWRGQA